MKILLIADVPGWAWDNKAKAIMKYLPQHEFKKVFIKDFKPKMINDFDVVHSLSWSMSETIAPLITANISSFHFKLKHKKKFDSIMPKYRCISTVSRQLYDIIKKIDINENLYCCPNGVDHNVFVPDRKKHDDFTVGWVGNPTEGGFDRSNGKMDIKGFGHILKPLMKRLGNRVKFKLHACKWKQAIPHEQMAEFYRDVDVMLCTSICEGTPNPMFEGASSGCALLSTKVGAISDCIENGVNGFTIPTYDKQSEADDRIGKFEKSILWLSTHREKCRAMGEESRKIIENNWTWEQRAKQWIPVFEKGKEE